MTSGAAKQTELTQKAAEFIRETREYDRQLRSGLMFWYCMTALILCSLLWQATTGQFVGATITLILGAFAAYCLKDARHNREKVRRAREDVENSMPRHETTQQ